MTNEQTAPEVPGATANVADGSGQGTGEGGTGDGQGAQGTPAPGGGEAGASGGVSGDAGAAGSGEGSGEGGEGGTPGESEGGAETPLEITLPEGIELSAEWRSSIEALAKADMTPAQRAQAFVDAGVKFQGELTGRMQDQVAHNIEAWAVASKADPEIGGTSYDTNVALAQLAVGKFGTPELKEAFETMGLGNHPEFVRVFARIGKAMAEGGTPHGLGQEAAAAPVNSEQAMADRMSNAASKPAKKLPPGA